jgi:hypothetical protein
VPTVPPACFLDRAASEAAYPEALGLAEALLAEVVNFAGVIFGRCAVLPAPKDHQLAILFSYRHLIDMVDGIQVLVAKMAPSSARLQLRAAFEALLTVEHLTVSDSERRAYAYLVGDTLGQVGYLERLRDAGHPEPRPGWYDSMVGQLMARLARPGWTNAHGEFVTRKAELRRNPGARWWPPWYALYGDPTDLAGLAGKYGRTKDYDLLYRSWSDVSHGLDVTWQLTPEANMRPLRSPLHFKGVVALAVEFLLGGVRHIALFYALENWETDCRDWYIAERIDQRLKELEDLVLPV